MEYVPESICMAVLYSLFPVFLVCVVVLFFEIDFSFYGGLFFFNFQFTGLLFSAYKSNHACIKLLCNESRHLFNTLLERSFKVFNLLYIILLVETLFWITLKLFVLAPLRTLLNTNLNMWCSARFCTICTI